MGAGRASRSSIALVLVVVLVGALVVVQLTRSVPKQTLTATQLAAFVVPGSADLPWPTSGQAAVTIEGVTPIRTSGEQTPVPIASLAKIMTATLILKDHPLTGDDDGPALTVTAADVATYEADVANQDSVLEVSAGETLSERQALEALLIPSADNIADLLAEWDAGGVDAFTAKMTAAANALGLHNTTYTDPSGVASTTVSTAYDQLIITSAAMTNPVFASIVAMPNATFPLAGTVQNFDFEVGHDGVVGVKTGSDSAAQGCWAFAATRTIDGTTRSVFGVVLGIPGTSQGLLEPALHAGIALADAIPATVRQVTVLPAGTVVAEMQAPWRSPITVRTTHAVHGLAQSGSSVHLALDLPKPAGTNVSAGQVVGSLTASGVTGVARTSLASSATGAGPTLWWRLSRT